MDKKLESRLSQLLDQSVTSPRKSPRLEQKKIEKAIEKCARKLQTSEDFHELERTLENGIQKLNGENGDLKKLLEDQLRKIEGIEIDRFGTAFSPPPAEIPMEQAERIDIYLKRHPELFHQPYKRVRPAESGLSFPIEVLANRQILVHPKLVDEFGRGEFKKVTKSRVWMTWQQVATAKPWPVKPKNWSRSVEFMRKERDLLLKLQGRGIVPLLGHSVYPFKVRGVKPADKPEWKVTMNMAAAQSSLLDVLEAPADQKQTSRWMHDLLIGLERTHANGITHNDIKPQNILIINGEATLADFGLAEKGEKKVKGTPSYFAPELLLASFYNAQGDAINYENSVNALTEKVDVYSLGVVLYLVKHRIVPPFFGHELDFTNPGNIHTFTMLIYEWHKAYETYGTRVPLDQEDDIILAMTMPDPNDRISAHEALRRFNEIVRF